MAVSLLGTTILPQFLKNDGTLNALGILEFLAAGTATPKAVYADRALTVSIGTSVALDAAGRKEIWLNGSYKIRCKDSLLNLLWEVDNINVEALENIITVATPTTLTDSDSGKVYIVTAAVTMTLPSAATIPNGWHVRIVNTSAGTVTVARIGGDTINNVAANITINPTNEQSITRVSSSNFQASSGFSSAQTYDWSKPQNHSGDATDGPSTDDYYAGTVATANLRWKTGINASGDFIIQAYDNSGVLVGTLVNFTRTTGIALFGRAGGSAIVADAPGSSTYSCDAARSNSYNVTVFASATFTMNAPTNPVGGFPYTWFLNVGATAVTTITWPANFKWTGGINPTGFSANTENVISCAFNGTNFVCNALLGAAV